MFLNHRLIKTNDQLEGFSIITEIQNKMYSDLLKFKVLGDDGRLIACTLRTTTKSTLKRDDLVYLSGQKYLASSGALAIAVHEVRIIEDENDIDTVRETLTPTYYINKIKFICQKKSKPYREPTSYQESKEMYFSLAKEG